MSQAIASFEGLRARLARIGDLALRLIALALVATCLAATEFAASARAAEKLIADRVFLVADPKATTIQFQMIVLAGCADEANNDCKGIAHYLEHLVLVGRNAEHKDIAMRFFADGSSNGWTNIRLTGYVHQFPAKSADIDARLDRLFEFYAGRLRGFDITPEDAARERNVVRQERDWRYGSNPFSDTWRDASKFLFPDHPLGQAVIGTPEGIASFTIDEARAFLARWYRRANVYFIVSGPVDESALRRIADNRLAGLDPAPPPPRDWLARPLTLTPAVQEFRKQDARISEVSVNIARTIPFQDDDEIKTLAAKALINEFLSSKLTGSPHSVLVEQEGVASGTRGANIDRAANGALYFGLGATPEPEISPERLRDALQSYMTRLADAGLDEKTIARLKKRYAQSYARALADPQTASRRLINWLETPLPYEKLAGMPDVVANLSVDDINRLLRALKAPGRDAIVIFAPKVSQ